MQINIRCRTSLARSHPSIHPPLLEQISNFLKFSSSQIYILLQFGVAQQQDEGGGRSVVIIIVWDKASYFRSYKSNFVNTVYIYKVC